MKNVPPRQPLSPRVRGLYRGGAVLYLLAISFWISQAFETSFWITLLCVAATLATIFLLALVLALRWALREDAQRIQVRLSSVMIATALIGLYLGAMRWLVQASGTPIESLRAGQLGTVLLFGMLITLVSAPFLLILGEAFMALLAWLVWRPSVQSAVRRLRHRLSSRRSYQEDRV